MGDDEWTVVSKGSRRKMSSTAFRALQVRAEHESGPAEDPPDASVDKTWSQIERAVREIRDAPFAKTLLRRMEDAGFVPNHTRAKPGEGLPETAVTHAATPGTRNFSSDEGAKHPTKHPVRSILRYSRMVILGLGSPTRSAVSRFQLALALVLARHLRIDAEDVDLYDPVFTPVDVATLRAKRVGTVLDRAAADAACRPGRGAGARVHVLVHAALRGCAVRKRSPGRTAAATTARTRLRSSSTPRRGRKRKRTRTRTRRQRSRRLRFREPVRDVRAPVGRSARRV